MSWDLSAFSAPLQAHLQRHLDALDEAAVAANLPAWGDAEQTQLLQLCLCSDYAAEKLARHPDWLRVPSPLDFYARVTPQAYAAALAAACADATNEKAVARALRQFRSHAMTRIIFRDVNGLAAYTETVADLSALADAAISVALEHAIALLAPQFGHAHYPATEPDAASTPRMPMVVLAMGKLGARELNLSSDIDLIFAYPREGETLGGRRSLDHRDYFARVGQMLIRLLDDVTADGFVFRVDMRLRPYGKSGALALNFTAMEHYYEEQGREWERYAMIKARPVGDSPTGAELLETLRPFVYRRYIDFSVIEALRQLKTMINQEVQRKGYEHNIKLGAGGIRDIEFTAQMFQLIRGGQDTQLQCRNLLQTLHVLEQLELLPTADIEALSKHYVFLRNLEHRIQALQDKQTQLLPSDALSRERVAKGLGFADWAALDSAQQAARQRVRVCFDAVIAAPEARHADDEIPLCRAIWHSDVAETMLEPLAELGFDDPAGMAQQLLALLHSRGVVQLAALPRQRLDQLMPRLLAACSQQDNPGVTLLRALPLVEAILRRSAYMVLLIENPMALLRLCGLLCASPWVADTIATYPLLLDELLNEEALLTPPLRDELEDELRQRLVRIPEEDLEQQMIVLRQFQRGHVLRVAASELAGTLPVMKVSDYLTWVAEVVLGAVLDIAWQQTCDLYGEPCDQAGNPLGRAFIIVAYGKLGGIELSYRSDLDLVFIHDTPSDGVTNGGEQGGQSGAKSIDNPVFFARLAQKIIHILTSNMALGKLYEVDLRLRPSGSAGLLVSSLQSFEDYQMNKAWTWEQQALVRARVVAGADSVLHGFQAVRQKILAKSRDASRLGREVCGMRLKMIAHLSSAKTAELKSELLQSDRVFDIKQDPGGLVDIEFLTQFWVLRDAHSFPELTKWTDNMRILDSLVAAGRLAADVASELQTAYLELRSQLHVLALQNVESRVSGERFAGERQRVHAIWQTELGSSCANPIAPGGESA